MFLSTCSFQQVWAVESDLYFTQPGWMPKDTVFSFHSSLAALFLTSIKNITARGIWKLISVKYLSFQVLQKHNILKTQTKSSYVETEELSLSALLHFFKEKALRSNFQLQIHILAWTLQNLTKKWIIEFETRCDSK